MVALSRTSGRHEDGAWTIGQVRLLVAWTMTVLYK